MKEKEKENMSDTKETRIKDALYQPLTVDSRKGRGGTYGYVKWQAVADRMNDTFGMNWSSNVESQEIIGDLVIVRVSVCAKDPVSGQEFCQEGYGGSQMRPSDEAGSAHKGAYSKALKDACKKWGVGLHLEENNEPSFSNKPSGYSGHETAAPVPSAPPPTTPYPTSTPPDREPAYTMPTQQSVDTSLPATPPPAETLQQEVPVPPTPAPPATNVVPMPTPASAPAPAPTTNMAPAPSPMPAPGGPPAPASVSAPVVDATASPDAPGTINNVQEMAIKNLARLSGIEDPAQLLTDLVNKADTGLTRQVTNLSDLSYTEAVNVIKAAKNL